MVEHRKQAGTEAVMFLLEGQMRGRRDAATVLNLEKTYIPLVNANN